MPAETKRLINPMNTELTGLKQTCVVGGVHRITNVGNHRSGDGELHFAAPITRTLMPLQRRRNCQPAPRQAAETVWVDQGAGVATGGHDADGGPPGR